MKTQRHDQHGRQEQEDVDQGKRPDQNRKRLVGYADTLAKQGATSYFSQPEEAHLHGGGDGEDPSHLDPGRVHPASRERVRDPGREQDHPEHQVDERERPHLFTASTREGRPGDGRPSFFP
jgi:hypothetical protein